MKCTLSVMLCLLFFFVNGQDTSKLKMYEVIFDRITDSSFLFAKRDSSSFAKGNYSVTSESQQYTFSVNENGKINGRLFHYNTAGVLQGEYKIAGGILLEEKGYSNGILLRHKIINYTKREVKTLLYEKNALYAENTADMVMNKKLEWVSYASITPDNYYSLKLYYPDGSIKQTSVLKNKIITTKDFSKKGAVIKTTQKYAVPGLPDVKAPGKKTDGKGTYRQATIKDQDNNKP
jgi:hypothetical protein